MAGKCCLLSAIRLELSWLKITTFLFLKIDLRHLVPTISRNQKDFLNLKDIYAEW
jgi:hypothetical protein